MHGIDWTNTNREILTILSRAVITKISVLFEMHLQASSEDDSVLLAPSATLYFGFKHCFYVVWIGRLCVVGGSFQPV